MTLSSKLGVRKYDVKTVMTTATENDGVYKLELSFNTEKELTPEERGRVRALAEALESAWRFTRNAKDASLTRQNRLTSNSGLKNWGFTEWLTGMVLSNSYQSAT